jgi:ketosteroid isomerase-like protein
MREGVLAVNATYDDGTRGELRVKLMPGPALMLDGRAFERSAVESPADATVRREIEEAYARLARALETKDYPAFQALRVDEFATIPPDGVPSPGSRMADRARGLIERIQPPITTTNDILELTTRGNDAIATVRQKFTRMQMIDGTPHTIHTEVTQRETWTRTSEGWKLLFVDEVRDHITLDNGIRVR